MRHAADLAFRQAIALCPRSPEAVFGNCNLLVQHKPTDDALLIVQSVLRSDRDSTPFRDLFRRLRENQ